MSTNIGCDASRVLNFRNGKPNQVTLSRVDWNTLFKILLSIFQEDKQNTLWTTLMCLHCLSAEYEWEATLFKTNFLRFVIKGIWEHSFKELLTGNGLLLLLLSLLLWKSCVGGFCFSLFIWIVFVCIDSLSPLWRQFEKHQQWQAANGPAQSPNVAHSISAFPLVYPTDFFLRFPRSHCSVAAYCFEAGKLHVSALTFACLPNCQSRTIAFVRMSLDKVKSLLLLLLV